MKTFLGLNCQWSFFLVKRQNDRGLTLLFMNFDLQMSANLEWKRTVSKALQVCKQYKISIINVLPFSFLQ